MVRATKHRWIGLSVGMALVVVLVIVIAINWYCSQPRAVSQLRVQPESISERNSTKYMCALAPSIDLYSTEAKSVKGSQDVSKWRSIKGTVTAIHENAVSLRTLSSDEVRVIFPVNIAQTWSTQLVPNHPDVTFTVGKTVCIDYIQSDHQPRDITPEQIVHIMLST